MTHAKAVCARHERAHRISEGCIYCVPVESKQLAAVAKLLEGSAYQRHTPAWRDEWAMRASYSACMVRVLAQAVLGTGAEYVESADAFGLTTAAAVDPTGRCTVIRTWPTWSTALEQQERRHIVHDLLATDAARHP